jgi:DNA-binding response OmpR family regulator
MKILVVEDERRVANIICRALRESDYAVDVASTGPRALQLAGEFSYDSILLDLRLPGISGIQVCRELREAHVETPILMVTARSMVEQRVEGLDAGADDYLIKPFAVSELLARVRALVRRRLQSEGATLHFGNIRLDRHRRRASYLERPVALTAREFGLLEFLISRAPSVASRSEILEHVWDLTFDSETNLVEVYINRLRQKLSAEGCPKVIRTVHGAGYCLKAIDGMTP